MRQKKYWLLGSAMILILLLAACGNGQHVPASSEREGNSNQQEEGLPTAGQALSPAEEAEPAEAGPVQAESEETEAGKSESEIPTPSSAPTELHQDAADAADGEEHAEMKMNVQIGGSVFTATLERNSAVDALVDMMWETPVTIQMSDYAGFEKVGPLGVSLPTSNQQTTTQAGDIVLYQGNQIVMFYGSNSWSYTRLGKIDDLTDWEKALGSGDVTVTFSLGE